MLRRVIDPPDEGTYLKKRRVLMRLRAAHRRSTPDVVFAADAYANLTEPLGEGFRMNRALQSNGGPPLVGKMGELVRCMDRAISTSPFRFPSKHVGEYLFRGISKEDFSRIKKNEVIDFPSYLSTSFMVVSPLLYASGGLLLLKAQIDLPCLFAPNEDEIILPRGTKWRVIGAEKQVRINVAHPKYKDTILRQKVGIIVMECIGVV